LLAGEDREALEQWGTLRYTPRENMSLEAYRRRCCERTSVGFPGGRAPPGAGRQRGYGDPQA
jgi:hypothetical protein